MLKALQGNLAAPGLITLFVVLAAIVATCTACLPAAVHLPADEQRIVDAAPRAWVAAGLPDPGDCLRGVTIQWARDHADFLTRCSATVGLLPVEGDAEGFSTHNPAACLAFRFEGNIDRLAVPVVLLAPGWPLWEQMPGESVVTHELLHALYACTRGKGARDAFDGNHHTIEAWEEHSGALSAQGRARVMLR